MGFCDSWKRLFHRERNRANIKNAYAEDRASMSSSTSSRMSWGTLLDETRVRKLMENKDSIKAEGESRSEFERDRDRTVYSSPVRRLIGKTQVFPLDPNDHVRTRLVHSLEVSTVAEGLAAQAVRDVIIKREALSDCQQRAISKIAETCGLLHDIGNPPFGHAGELAIASWFQSMIGTSTKLLESLGGKDSQKAQDFARFEGNSQTMRIITNTHLLGHDYGLSLTCAATSAARKYLASSLPCEKVSGDHTRSKPGYFLSEKVILGKVANQTGTEGRRHPITFIVEAADDIVYSAVDIEDGVKKRILSWKQVENHLNKECAGSVVLIEAKKQMDLQVGGGAGDSEKAQAFRVNAISETVRAAVRIFGKRYDEIMNGDYKQELVSDVDYDGATFVKACKDILKETVFVEDDVLRLEVRGRHVLHDLLNLFWEGTGEFLEDHQGSAKTYGGKLYRLIAGSYRVHFEKRIRDCPDDAAYFGLQLVSDYVSGMTDGFACRLHEDLTNGA